MTTTEAKAIRGQWMTLPVYSRKLHFFLAAEWRGQARPSLCPQFYSTFMSRAVRNPAAKDLCKTCKDRLASGYIPRQQKERP